MPFDVASDRNPPCRSPCLKTPASKHRFRLMSAGVGSEMADPCRAPRPCSISSSTRRESRVRNWLAGGRIRTLGPRVICRPFRDRLLSLLPGYPFSTRKRISPHQRVRILLSLPEPGRLLFFEEKRFRVDPCLRLGLAVAREASALRRSGRGVGYLPLGRSLR